ncbi:hypothetical protein [Teredinibacter purpureus]|uniref:hypothetical protein n=1 Tax=Teredinibacter purpureus TaxID=2731756 RepID=UPI0005F7A000|nr:hypothetical protein [Teredinibacter purpureus]
MRVLIAATVALSALLGGCGSGGGGSTNPTPTPDPTPDPTPTFTPTAFTGFMPAFEGDVALAIVSGHAITATRQLDINGDEKIYFYFENEEGEDIAGASDYDIDASIFPALYLEEDGIVCLQYAGYFEYTTSVKGDITSDAITFRQCDTDGIQAADISEDWQPTYMEFVSITQLADSIVTDSAGDQSFNLKATTDTEGDVRLYISNPFNATFEALVDVDRGIICSNFIQTGEVGAFFTRVTGSDELSTEGLAAYLGDDLVRDKIVFLPDCNYDLADWQE